LIKLKHFIFLDRREYNGYVQRSSKDINYGYINHNNVYYSTRDGTTALRSAPYIHIYTGNSLIRNQLLVILNKEIK